MIISQSKILKQSNHQNRQQVDWNNRSIPNHIHNLKTIILLEPTLRQLIAMFLYKLNNYQHTIVFAGSQKERHKLDQLCTFYSVTAKKCLPFKFYPLFYRDNIIKNILMLHQNHLPNYQQRRFQRRQENFTSPHQITKKNKSITLTKNKSTIIGPKIVFRNGENPQERDKDPVLHQNKLSQFLTVPNMDVQNKINSSFRHNPSTNLQLSHNLSTHNLRTTFSPIPFARKRKPHDESKQILKQKQPQIKNGINSFFRPKRQFNKTADGLEDRKVKEAPSFIKNKINHSNSPTMLDFKIVRSTKTEQQYKQLIVQHIKTRSLFTMKVYKKATLLKQACLFEEIKYYLKNHELNHNLIIKYFGCFTDTDYFYLIEQFIEGQTLQKYIQTHKMTEQEIGPKICELLTALSYLHCFGLSHGSITQQNIINSLNVCKLKRPLLISSRRDILFDIWALGKLTFEMLTGSALIEDSLLQNCHSVRDLFNNPFVVYGIETAFKCFDNNRVSRQAIKFLITTLWDIQGKQLKIGDIWELQFIKLYREDDMWLQSNGN